MTRSNVLTINTPERGNLRTRIPQVKVNARFIRLRTERTVTPRIAELVVMAADEIADAGTSDLLGDVRRRFTLTREEIVEILHKTGRQARRERDTLLLGMENSIAIGREAAAATWDMEAA